MTPRQDPGRRCSTRRGWRPRWSKLPGVSGDEARRLSRSRSLTFNAAYTAAVLRIADDLYAYSFDDGRAIRLTNAPGAEEHVSFSPDGKLVAVRPQQQPVRRPTSRPAGKPR